MKSTQSRIIIIETKGKVKSEKLHITMINRIKQIIGKVEIILQREEVLINIIINHFSTVFKVVIKISNIWASNMIMKEINLKRSRKRDMIIEIF